MSERGGRYQRSMAGMIGALIVTLVVIGGFVAWRGLNRDDLEVRPEAVDYRGPVLGVQKSGSEVVYPADLPENWTATSVTYDVAVQGFGVGILTADEQFVGMRDEDAPASELVERYVDEDAVEGDEVDFDTEVADTWRTFTDEGGDYALVAEDLGPTGDHTLIVYGSAGEDAVRELASRLTTEPVQR